MPNFDRLPARKHLFQVVDAIALIEEVGEHSLKPQLVALHVVSSPDATWLPVLVIPSGHATHAWFATFSLELHVIASHVVSYPDASSLPALVFPVEHATHA